MNLGGQHESPHTVSSHGMGHEQHGPGSMDHSSSSSSMMMMQMFFHTGYEQVVLLKQWSADSVLSMFSTCLFFFIMAILYELLKAYRRVVALRIQFINQSAIHLTNTSGTNGPSSGDQESRSDSEDPAVLTHHISTPNNGCLAGVQSGSSYGLSDTVTLDQGVSYRRTPSRMLVKNGPGSGSQLRLFSTWQEMFSCGHIRSTLLYTLQVMFAYLLMLAFMLFNVWISLAILLGAATGHFLLAQKAIALEDHANEDYCH